MKFQRRLLRGILIKRYKRFLADVRLQNGCAVTAHCPNSGSMLTCNVPGSPVLISRKQKHNAGLRYTLEAIRTGNIWVGVNTMLPNRLVTEALGSRHIPELSGYLSIQNEITAGNSRLDFLLSRKTKKCYVEVKNVTLSFKKVAFFPDAVTERGAKHLKTLTALRKEGCRAVAFFLVQREDCVLFRPASWIDPVYCKTLREAARCGVEVLVYQAHVTPSGIWLHRSLPFRI